MPGPQQRLDLDLQNAIKRHHAARSDSARMKTESRDRCEHEESEPPRQDRESRDRTDCSRDNNEEAVPGPISAAAVTLHSLRAATPQNLVDQNWPRAGPFSSIPCRFRPTVTVLKTRDLDDRITEVVLLRMRGEGRSAVAEAPFAGLAESATFGRSIWAGIGDRKELASLSHAQRKLDQFVPA